MSKKNDHGGGQYSDDITGVDIFAVGKDGRVELDDLALRDAAEVDSGDIEGVLDPEQPQVNKDQPAVQGEPAPFWGSIGHVSLLALLFVFSMATLAGVTYWIDWRLPDSLQSGSSRPESPGVRYVPGPPAEEHRVFAVMEGGLGLLPLAEAMEELPELVVLANPEVFLGGDGSVQASVSLRYPEFSGKPDILAAVAGDGSQEYALALEVGSDLDRDRAVQWAISIRALGEQVNAILLYSSGQSMLVDLVKGKISNPEIAHAFDAAMSLRDTVPINGRILVVCHDSHDKESSGWWTKEAPRMPPVNVHAVAEPEGSRLRTLATTTGGIFLDS